MTSNNGPFSTTRNADFIFEVPPNPKIFDTVRRAIADTLEAEYADVLAFDVREHIHVDVVDIDPADWVVTGRLNGDIPNMVDFEVRISPDSDTTTEIIEFLRSTIDARYGSNVDADAVTFEKIGMRPRAWFVDAKVPPSVDTDE